MGTPSNHKRFEKPKLEKQIISNVRINHIPSKQTLAEPLTATFKTIKDQKTKKEIKFKKLKRDSESADDKSAIFNPTPSVLNSKLSKE